MIILIATQTKQNHMDWMYDQYVPVTPMIFMEFPWIFQVGSVQNTRWLMMIGELHFIYWGLVHDPIEESL